MEALAELVKFAARGCITSADDIKREHAIATIRRALTSVAPADPSTPNSASDSGLGPVEAANPGTPSAPAGGAQTERERLAAELDSIAATNVGPEGLMDSEADAIRRAASALRATAGTRSIEGARLKLIRERAEAAHAADVEDWIEKHDALGVIVNLCDAPDGSPALTFVDPVDEDRK